MGPGNARRHDNRTQHHKNQSAPRASRDVHPTRRTSPPRAECQVPKPMDIIDLSQDAEPVTEAPVSPKPTAGSSRPALGLSHSAKEATPSEKARLPKEATRRTDSARASVQADKQEKASSRPTSSRHPVHHARSRTRSRSPVLRGDARRDSSLRQSKWSPDQRTRRSPLGREQNLGRVHPAEHLRDHNFSSPRPSPFKPFHRSFEPHRSNMRSDYTASDGAPRDFARGRYGRYWGITSETWHPCMNGLEHKYDKRCLNLQSGYMNDVINKIETKRLWCCSVFTSHLWYSLDSNTGQKCVEHRCKSYHCSAIDIKLLCKSMVAICLM